MRNILNDLFKIIGIITATAFLIAIPVLCGISFALVWAEEIMFLLSLLTLIETIGLFGVLMYIID